MIWKHTHGIVRVWKEAVEVLFEGNILHIIRLHYGSKRWTIKAKDRIRITAAEMEFMRRTAKTELARS
jgi:hypothetical protein